MEQWTEELQQLALWLQDQSTDPGIRRLLITMLNQWHNNQDPVSYQGPEAHLKTLATDQQAIGWFALLQGFLAQSVVDAQTAYFQDIRLHRSGMVWAYALCKQLWAFFESMWSTRIFYYHEQKDTGKQELHTALQEGIGHLYDQSASALLSQYTPFFRMPLDKILESGIVDQKNWFSLMFTAHEWQGSASSTIFSVNGTPRQWADLPPIRPLCPPIPHFADDQLWITLHTITPHIIMQYYHSLSQLD